MGMQVLEKYKGRNSMLRTKFFRQEVSSSSRSLPTNSQTKGLPSKRRIPLYFPRTSIPINQVLLLLPLIIYTETVQN
jgi:hypothetical protein